MSQPSQASDLARNFLGWFGVGQPDADFLDHLFFLRMILSSEDHVNLSSSQGVKYVG